MYCIECESEEVMCGEPSKNSAGEETVTWVCLDCGEAWEESVEEREQF